MPITRGNGVTRSPWATGLETPSSPLRRRIDQVLEYPCTGRPPAIAHVRIWTDDADRHSKRLVVLIGKLQDGAGIQVFLEDLVRYLDRTVLHGRAREATWFDYHPARFGGLGEHHVDNIELTFWPHYTNGTNDTAAQGSFWKRWINAIQRRPAPGRDLHPEWRTSSLHELERVVGAAVECYPPAAYTRETVRRRAAEPDRVHEVVHDRIYARPLLDALRYFHSVSAEHEFAATATRVCTMLADAIRERWRILDASTWDDGTHPHGERPWPRLFAARLVPPKLTAEQQVLLDRYPDAFDVTRETARWAILQRMLGQLRVWREETAKDAEVPDPHAHEAVVSADNLLSTYMRAVNPAFADEDHPDNRIRRFVVAGEFDRRYLDTITWDDEPGRGVRYRRLWEHVHAGERDRVRFGCDQWHHLIAYIPNQDPDAPASFVVEWPLRPPAEHVGPGCLIVSGGDTGDRPAYLEFPDGSLAPLPDHPGHRESQWNFGYSGGGPAALEAAIMRLFTRIERISDGAFPDRWLAEQIKHAPQDRLVLSVAEIQERIDDLSSEKCRATAARGRNLRHVNGLAWILQQVAPLCPYEETGATSTLDGMPSGERTSRGRSVSCWSMHEPTFVSRPAAVSRSAAAPEYCDVRLSV